MNPELSHVLAELASKMGTSVEKLWPILVARERLSSILVMIIGAILATWSSFLLHKVVHDKESNEPPLIGIVCLLILIGTMITLVFIPSAVYPEAAVVKELLRQWR